MSETTKVSSLIGEAKHDRVYSSSVLRAARHRWTVSRDARAIEFADELQRRPEVLVAAVVDPEMRPLGILRRDRLFALLGKPFGREVMGRMPVSELAESAPTHGAHESIFAVAPEALERKGEEEVEYRLLVDEEGRFQAVLAARDLSDYLSRMTREDIDLAGKLQERLIAGSEALGGEDWGFEAWSRPAKGIGGDFFFTKGLAGGKAFLALCDVSGKGVAASLVVSMAWGMLAMYDFEKGLEGLVRSLNEAIVESFHLEKYLTGFFAVYDPRSRSLSVADMGHSQALVFRGGRALSPKSERVNLPVGIESGLEPRIASWRLSAGDRLLVYTDGLTEQEDPRGEEFGVRRLALAAAAALAGGAPLSEAIPAAADGFRGRTPQQDDMSFMALSLY